MRKSLVFGPVLVALVPVAAGAKDKPPAPPAEIEAVFACRAKTDATARLACFDEASAALDAAINAGEVRAASKKEVTDTRRKLFGLTLPKIGLFGSDDDEEDISEFTGTIQGVRTGKNGYILTLDDGSVWSQTDGQFIRPPKQGKSVTIKKAALGSYMGTVEGSVGVRMKRLQ